MISHLPRDRLKKLEVEFPCRQAQIHQIAAFYNPVYPNPPTLVVWSHEQTQKLAIIEAVLKAQEFLFAIVRSRDCLSQRHLISSIFSSCLNALQGEGDIEQYERVDNLNTLLVNLQKLLQEGDQKVVLVVDGIERQRGAGPTLLPALARLGPQIPNLSVILTSNSARPLQLHRAGVPYIHFPPFSRAEAIHIILQAPPALPTDLEQELDEAELQRLTKIHGQFAVTVYDSLASSTCSLSIQKFQSICDKLWPRFIWPYFSGERPPGTASRWDFARLMVKSRSLFQSEGEYALIERLIVPSQTWTFEELRANDNKLLSSQQEVIQLRGTSSRMSKSVDVTLSQTSGAGHPDRPLLQRFTTIVLVASYLASYTPTKHDIVLFSRLSSSSSIRKYRRFGSSTPQKRKYTKSPSKSKSAEDIAATPEKTKPTPGKTKTGRTSKAMKSLFDSKMAIARPFTLERLLAILRAIHPDTVPMRRGLSDRVYQELGELERLKLVARVSGSSHLGIGTGTGTAAAANEDQEDKWKINVGREWVLAIAKHWGVGVMEYETDQLDV